VAVRVERGGGEREEAKVSPNKPNTRVLVLHTMFCSATRSHAGRGAPREFRVVGCVLCCVCARAGGSVCARLESSMEEPYTPCGLPNLALVFALIFAEDEP